MWAERRICVKLVVRIVATGLGRFNIKITHGVLHIPLDNKHVYISLMQMKRVSYEQGGEFGNT